MTRIELPQAREGDSDLFSYYAFAVCRAKRYRKLLSIFFAIFAILVIGYVHVAEPVYLAVAALTPPKDALLDSSGLSGAAGGLASIGRRLGVGLGSAGSGENYDLFDEYTRVLQSYRLAGTLAGTPSFLALAFPRQFNPETGHLKARHGAVAAAVDGVKSLLGLPLVSSSDGDQVFKFLTTNLTISQPRDPTTNISEVVLRFNDGPAAEKILDIVLAQADTLMRADKHRDIAARIAYLKDQLQRVTLEDQRTALISLLTLQQNTMMIIAADHRYASYVVEAPHSPLKPVWPSTGAVLGLVVFLSALCWSLTITLLPERILDHVLNAKILTGWHIRKPSRALSERPRY